MDWRRPNFLQPGQHSLCDGLDILPRVRTSPLNQTRFLLHVSELVCEGITPRETQVILIQPRHGAGDSAQRRRRIMSVKENLLQRSARGLLQYESAQLAQIANGTDHRIKFLSVGELLGQ